jgi:hypothetical protein
MPLRIKAGCREMGGCPRRRASFVGDPVEGIVFIQHLPPPDGERWQRSEHMALSQRLRIIERGEWQRSGHRASVIYGDCVAGPHGRDTP